MGMGGGLVVSFAVKGALRQWFMVDALLIPPLFSVHGVMWFNHLINTAPLCLHKTYILQY